MNGFVRASALMAILFLLGGFLAACGGDDGDAGPTSTVAAPAADDATETPDDEPTEKPTDEERPTTEAAGESPFDTYHYTVDLELTISEPGEEDQAFVSGRVEGDFVAPDSHRFATTYDFAGLSATQEVVIVGDDAWMREGQGAWAQSSRFDPAVLDTLDLTSADPGFLQDEEFADDISVLDSEPDTVNGVAARKYFIPKEAVATLTDLLGDGFLEDASGIEEFEMTVWLEEETDALVRADFTATASPEFFGGDTPFDLSVGAMMTISMRIDLSRINDPDIEIEPPA